MYSYPKAEKLKSRKQLQAVFATKQTVLVHPVKAFCLQIPYDNAAIQIGVGVSSRNFKKAVDRNRIKRLMREVYRLNKEQLIVVNPDRKITMLLFFLFIGRELPNFELIEKKMRLLFQKINNQINPNNNLT
ncbi:MAG: ribonuclease P protein component [Chitinophagaceae bacterium]